MRVASQTGVNGPVEGICPATSNRSEDGLKWENINVARTKSEVKIKQHTEIKYNNSRIKGLNEVQINKFNLSMMSRHITAFLSVKSQIYSGSSG